jgi:nucleotide-binding universal stress UspA family protein
LPDLNVVVAIDGSPLSEASLRYLELLKAFGTLHVKLVAVAETYKEHEDINGVDAHIERERRLLDAYLERTCEDLDHRLGIKAEADLRVGIPDNEVLEAARDARADVLLLTTHGRAGVGRWAIGSVADKVIKHCDRPALVIGPEVAAREAPPTIRDILVPLDGSELAEQALPVAKRWSEALKARLHLVRVVKIPVVSSPEMTVGPDLMTAMQEAAETYLARIKSEVAPDAVTEAAVGGTADLLTDYVREHDIGLVVMTSHGRGGLLRSVLGSVTDRMLHGPAPVLVVRAA